MASHVIFEKFDRTCEILINRIDNSHLKGTTIKEASEIDTEKSSVQNLF